MVSQPGQRPIPPGSAAAINTNGWLVFNGSFSTKRLYYRAMQKFIGIVGYGLASQLPDKQG